MTIEPIGTIATPFTTLEQMPIQPKGAADVQGRLILKPEFAEGLRDLEGFSHIYVIYHFHEATRTQLTVTPFMDTQERGVFATRSPLRPLHIGMSVTQVVSITDNIVTVRGIDVLNETPLLDIKPYVPQFDSVENVKTGWMTRSEDDTASMRSDDRFI